MRFGKSVMALMIVFILTISLAFAKGGTGGGSRSSGGSFGRSSGSVGSSFSGGGSRSASSFGRSGGVGTSSVSRSSSSFGGTVSRQTSSFGRSTGSTVRYSTDSSGRSYPVNNRTIVNNTTVIVDNPSIQTDNEGNTWYLHDDGQYYETRQLSEMEQKDIAEFWGWLFAIALIILIVVAAGNSLSKNRSYHRRKDYWNQ